MQMAHQNRDGFIIKGTFLGILALLAAAVAMLPPSAALVSDTPLIGFMLLMGGLINIIYGFVNRTETPVLPSLICGGAGLGSAALVLGVTDAPELTVPFLAALYFATCAVTMLPAQNLLQKRHLPVLLGSVLNMAAAGLLVAGFALPLVVVVSLQLLMTAYLCLSQA